MKLNTNQTSEQQCQPTASNSETQPTTTSTMTTELPPSATRLIDQPDDRIPPIEDDDPHAALELIRDAIILFNEGARATSLKRGSYEVVINKAPEKWRGDAQYAVHLDFITKHIVPDPNEPSIYSRGAANLWSEPLSVIREIVTDHLGAEQLDEFTARREGR